MSIFTLINSSFNNLWANKKRAFLTMLGIIIGVGSVIIIMSVGAGAQSLIVNEISSFGTNLFAVMPGSTSENGPPASVMGITVTTLKLKEINDIKKIPHVEAVSAYVRGTGTMSYQNQTSESTFVGVNASLPTVESIEINHGRFFTPDEVKSMARVVVLGYKVKTDLFGDNNPVGKNIKIKKHKFKVIGYLDTLGNVAFENKDTQVYIPITTAQKIMLGINHVSIIRGKVDNTENNDFVIKQVKKIIRQHHHISNSNNDDFTVRSLEQALSVITSVTDSLKLFLAGIAAISLIVGGIGIMNIMLVNVTERTKEIGLRKSVGATTNDILIHFLTESATLTLIGGSIGILIGVLLSWLIAISIKSIGYDWDFVVSWLSILLGLSVSISVGLIFGSYPAKQAADLEPVEALRTE